MSVELISVLVAVLAIGATLAALIMSYPSALGTADAPLRKNNLRHATGRHS